jgi:hypothetical protein
MHCFITPDGVFTASRVLHGARNAVAYFQSVVQELISPIRDALLQWLEDFLIFTHTEAELMISLRQFFSVCREFGLNRHPCKCILFASTVRWFDWRPM